MSTQQDVHCWQLYYMLWRSDNCLRICTQHAAEESPLGNHCSGYPPGFWLLRNWHICPYTCQPQLYKGIPLCSTKNQMGCFKSCLMGEWAAHTETPVRFCQTFLHFIWLVKNTSPFWLPCLGMTWFVDLYSWTINGRGFYHARADWRGRLRPWEWTIHSHMDIKEIPKQHRFHLNFRHTIFIQVPKVFLELIPSP